jgi:hypothetical protein
MAFKGTLEVTYDLYASTYAIKKHVPKILGKFEMLSLDTETRSTYNKETRKEASAYLKEGYVKDEMYKQARVVSASSGLSFPSIVNTTHFIFGESKTHSSIIVCDSEEKEMMMWQMIADYQSTFLIHNALFDLKIMYQRIGRLPKNYIDTSLLVKCLINHVNVWKAKTSLKELMGEYYESKWSIMNEYEPENLKNKDFLAYCAIDGAATMYLYDLIQKEVKNVEYSSQWQYEDDDIPF